MIEKLESCEDRVTRYTPEYGGMLYWYCNRDTKQINVYEDCEKCRGGKR